MSETEIRSLLQEFASAKRTGDFFLDHGTDDFIFVRPSGNPLDAEGFSAMFQSGDLTVHDSELIALERLNFHANIAIAVFTMRGNFTYRGQHNSDTYVATAVLRNLEGEWRFALFQRSAGSTDLSIWKALSD
ncbi:MAG TPA: elongation factor Tu [Gammaproteobacteria bacterium]|nr:elongation factor Tu [Gammaproteobacteria bacterium]HBX26615.1 elongation factor Tu [Gammaproteobacteria bacterium]|tara:strand:+ start:297 stop:692 length:396 start_codon:yes stop_codon:yes gene_type:complete